MKIAEAVSPLTWVQPDSQQREYHLVTADQKIASVSWAKEGGTLADAMSEDGRWSFKRGGFLHPRITARKDGSDAAVFEPGMSGNGVVHLTSGHIFRWSSNLWRGEWSWVNAAGKGGIKIRREFSMDTRQGRVEIIQDAIPRLEIPLLVLFGWYIVILLSEDGALIADR